MSNIVPFERPEPHGHGAAFCMACNHTWTAVAPVGTTELTCPACGTQRGRFTFDFAPPTTHLWTCTCDNQLFNVTQDGIFCPRCGEYQTFPK